MAATAAFAALTAEPPVAWTTRELDTWLATRPASEKAELKWARPGLQAALDRLLTGPLDLQAIDVAARQVTRVALGCRRFLWHVLRGTPPIAALQQAWTERLPGLAAFLGSPIATSHAAKALHALLAIGRAEQDEFRSYEEQQRAALEQEFLETDLDDLVQLIMEGVSVEYARAHTLLSALLEAADRGGTLAERGCELARLALRHVVRGVVELRRHEGLTIEVLLPELQQFQDDALLDASATLALSGREDFLWQLAEVFPGCVEPGFEENHPSAEEVSPPARVYRIVGEVAGVQFIPSCTITLHKAGMYYGFSASPELVARALVYREMSVRALVLGGASERLLRIDPASDENAPDSSTRTRDMLHDWDELLRRLAR